MSVAKSTPSNLTGFDDDDTCNVFVGGFTPIPTSISLPIPFAIIVLNVAIFYKY